MLVLECNMNIDSDSPRQTLQKGFVKSLQGILKLLQIVSKQSLTTNWQENKPHFLLSCFLYWHLHCQVLQIGAIMVEDGLASYQLVASSMPQYGLSFISSILSLQYLSITSSWVLQFCYQFSKLCINFNNSNFQLSLISFWNDWLTSFVFLISFAEFDLQELITYGLFSLFFLIAGIVAASKSYLDGTIVAAAVCLNLLNFNKKMLAIYVI